MSHRRVREIATTILLKLVTALVLVCSYITMKVNSDLNFHHSIETRTMNFLFPKSLWWDKVKGVREFLPIKLHTSYQSNSNRFILRDERYKMVRVWPCLPSNVFEPSAILNSIINLCHMHGLYFSS